MRLNDPLYQIITVPDEKNFQVTNYVSSERFLWNINNHYHDLYEIVLYKKISGRTTLNGREEELCSNSILYLPPYCAHGFSDLSKVSEYIVLHIPFNYLEKLPVEPMLFKLSQPQSETIENLMLWSIDSSHSIELKEQAIKLILLWINNLGSSDTVSYRGGSTLFKPFLQFLDRTRGYDITSRKAAELCGMSRSSFMEKFKVHFGSTFHSFLTNKRISEAKYLLKNSDMNCTDIANHLKFSDSAHFSRVFYKSEGVNPKSYQKI